RRRAKRKRSARLNPLNAIGRRASVRPGRWPISTAPKLHSAMNLPKSSANSGTAKRHEEKGREQHGSLFSTKEVLSIHGGRRERDRLQGSHDAEGLHHGDRQNSSEPDPGN